MNIKNYLFQQLKNVVNLNIMFFAFSFLLQEIVHYSISNENPHKKCAYGGFCLERRYI